MSSGPVPKMPVGVWEQIKYLDCYEEGWIIEGQLKQLAISREDTLGKTAWVLWDYSPPGGMPYAPMPYDQWQRIREGYLDTDNNFIIKGEYVFRIVFHQSEDRNVFALVEEV